MMVGGRESSWCDIKDFTIDDTTVYFSKDSNHFSIFLSGRETFVLSEEPE